MKITKLAFITIALLAILVVPQLSLAESNPSNATQIIDVGLINAAGEGAGFPGKGEATEIPQTVGRLVSIVLSLVGALFFIFIVTAGIQWMTAGGNEESVSKAKQTITRSIIGLAITVAAYFITWFISNALGAIGTTPAV